ncbi:MAG: flagellar basal body protein, partial [Pseudomonas sp.]
MSISFDKALGIHEQALGFRAQRAEVLANNIANADTPNYKAR